LEEYFTRAGAPSKMTLPVTRDGFRSERPLGREAMPFLHFVEHIIQFYTGPGKHSDRRGGMGAQPVFKHHMPG
jgi:hypothetical protein